NRPNRFVANVELCGKEISVHVKNTGRCKELLVPGAYVYLEDFTARMGSRKMAYDLIAVEKGDLLVNMDSQAPNKAAAEALKDGRISLPGMTGPLFVRPETKYGDSRFDFYVQDAAGREGFVEVKGVTLEFNREASFPDAPTERGVKHINELVKAHDEGYMSYILFIVQMEGMKSVRPNDETHRAFGDALRAAASKGVHVLAYECSITPDTMEVGGPVKVEI
ncbi:MAG: DNA/RNA nuclease SfsA, partial [Parasporobacterium sp.]|nr:DNA/RNA nuclease SfsA [Parasporobacterium sp.]